VRPRRIGWLKDAWRLKHDATAGARLLFFVIPERVALPRSLGEPLFAHRGMVRGTRGKGPVIFGSKTSQFLALAAINLVCIIVLIVVVELVLGNWLTPYVVPRNGIVNRNYFYRQDLYPPFGTITSIRDRFGLRGV
jgi:hypothetical protein